ncbi:MAG: alginate export family protein [Planctomycetes bacterium]|nr:alginate export family protein [Planctomycetota bacterium]
MRASARSFDGGRWRWHPSETSDLDLFVVQLREDRATRTTHDDSLFAGLYWAAKCDEGALDLYALFLNDEMTAAGRNENRLTLGARGVRRFDAFEVGAELATQAGEVDGADIPIGETYGAHLHGTYRFDGRSKPYVRADLDAASGNDPGSGDNERFDVLFPTAHAHLGMMDLAFWENVVHASFAYGFEPCESSQLEASWRWFRSMESTDSFGGPNVVLSTGGAGIDEDLGHELDLKFRVNLDTKPAKTYVEVGYGMFFPGQGVKDSRGSDDLAHFFYAQGDLRF